MAPLHASRSRTRVGLVRLVEHCDTLGRVTAAERATARARLEGELGSDLARLLVGALARRDAGQRALAL